MSTPVKTMIFIPKYLTDNDDFLIRASIISLEDSLCIYTQNTSVQLNMCIVVTV